MPYRRSTVRASALPISALPPFPAGAIDLSALHGVWDGFHNPCKMGRFLRAGPAIRCMQWVLLAGSRLSHLLLRTRGLCDSETLKLMREFPEMIGVPGSFLARAFRQAGLGSQAADASTSTDGKRSIVRVVPGKSRRMRAVAECDKRLAAEDGAAGPRDLHASVRPYEGTHRVLPFVRFSCHQYVQGSSGNSDCR